MTTDESKVTEEQILETPVTDAPEDLVQPTPDTGPQDDEAKEDDK